MESLAAAAAAAGVPAGALRFTLAIFACPLLSAVHACVRGAGARHAVSCALGAALCVFVFGTEGSGNLVAPVAASYALTAAARRQAGAVVFAATFSYLIWWCVRACASG